MRVSSTFSMAALAATGALLGVSSSGCSSFQDVTTVIDLRILGIKAEPAEIYVDPSMLSGTINPFNTTLTALVVDPQGNGRAVTYDVLACPRDIDTVTAATGRNGVVCAHNVPGQTPNSLEVVSPDAPASTTDPGPVHEIPVPFSVPASLLSLAFSVDPYAAQGFQLPVVVQMELGAGSESIVATKRMIFSQQLPDRPPQAPNQNPTVTKVTVYAARDQNADPISPMELVQGTPVAIPLGGQLWFEPGGAIAESYSTRTLTRDTPPQVITTDVAAETLRFAFFTTAGTFSQVETSTVASPIFTINGRVHIESLYTAPTVMPANPNLTVWIVTRDERGGASWTTRQIQLVQP